MKTTDN